MTSGDTISLARRLLLVLAGVFAILAFRSLTNPVGSLSPQGIQLKYASGSAMAELRAFYFGTNSVISLIALRGGNAGSTEMQRTDSLCIVGGLLGFFVLGRLYSWFADGAPELAISYALWGIEAIGAACCYYLQNKTSDKK